MVMYPLAKPDGYVNLSLPDVTRVPVLNCKFRHRRNLDRKAVVLASAVHNRWEHDRDFGLTPSALRCYRMVKSMERCGASSVIISIVSGLS